jgi:hypothetical protein
MSTGDLNRRTTSDQTRVFAPRHAPCCRCADHEVTASRDEDGDWICCGCGRQLTPSLGLRGLRPAVGELELRAA